MTKTLDVAVLHLHAEMREDGHTLLIKGNDPEIIEIGRTDTIRLHRCHESGHAFEVAVGLCLYYLFSINRYIIVIQIITTFI